MRTHRIFLLAVLVTGVGMAQSPVDPYMGDWKGSVTIGDKEQSVAVFMIPRGDGRYEARTVSEFNRRVPYLDQLRGMLRAGKGTWMDAIPFDVSRVVGTAANGVILDASLWTGSIENDVLRGTIAGNRQGSFEFRPHERTSPDLGAKPPAGAVVLFDGSNLDAWRSRDPDRPVRWKLVEGGAMEVSGGDIVSRETFGDHRLHVEFRTPYMPHASGQGRGNSGVYVHGRYEVQVLDSYGLEGHDNECGGIYQIARPLVHMCFPPLQWQSYDITFRAARFNASGKKTENARITVRHNGVVIHDNLELPRATGGALDENERAPHGLLLQDHRDPVQFRNIWAVRF
jgi:hypothetical protein